MEKFKNTTLIVSTCEKNKYLLDNFFKLLKIHFDFDGLIKITINSYYNFPGYKIETIHKKLKDDSFSTSLIYSLKEINSDYVIFILEDFYLLNKIDNKIIESAISILDKDEKITNIQLNDQSFIKQFRYSKRAYNKYFLVKNNACPYSCNAQFAIWRKNFLLKVLRYKESAWQFEYYGSLRVNKYKHVSLTINDKYKKGSDLYPDGGILKRGKIIKNFGELYKKFNLEPFYQNLSSSLPANPLKFNRLKAKLMERFYPALHVYFPFLAKFIINPNYVSHKIWTFFDCCVDSKEYQLKHPKIGILYIATGKYICFWKTFYKSFEKNFLPGYEKIYYLFTDSDLNNLPDNVKLIYQENLGWPNNTLLRYKNFLEHKEMLELCQYLYFVNANIICRRKVGPEILPNDNQQLVVTLHPGLYKATKDKFAYERNSKSTAYIPYNQGEYYFMGGFNGGITKHFLNMCEEINKNITIDLNNKIIAVWHDESHLNKYMLDKKPLILSPQYGFPEGMPWNEAALSEFKNNYKMIIQDKNKWGGHNYLRGINNEKNH